MVPPALTPADVYGTARKHPWHLVDPSPWPAIGALAAGVLAVGAVFYIRAITPWLLVAGALAIMFTMAGWFRQVIREATFQGHHTAPVRIGMCHGMVLFIASEVMFFSAWFWPSSTPACSRPRPSAGCGRRPAW